MKLKGRNAASLGKTWKAARTLYLFFLLYEGPYKSSTGHNNFLHITFHFTYYTFTLHIILYIYTCRGCFVLFSSYSKFQGKSNCWLSVCQVSIPGSVNCGQWDGAICQNMALMDPTSSPISSLVTSCIHSIFYWYQ